MIERTVSSLAVIASEAKQSRLAADEVLDIASLILAMTRRSSNPIKPRRGIVQDRRLLGLAEIRDRFAESPVQRRRSPSTASRSGNCCRRSSDPRRTARRSPSRSARSRRRGRRGRRCRGPESLTLTLGHCASAAMPSRQSCQPAGDMSSSMPACSSTNTVSGNARASAAPSSHLAGKDLQFEQQAVIGKPRQSAAPVGVVHDIGSRREAILRILVPMQLLADAARRRQVGQTLQQRSRRRDRRGRHARHWRAASRSRRTPTAPSAPRHRLLPAGQLVWM